MTWALFLNNQTVEQASLLPDGKYGANVRYIFIQGREEPIIFTDEKSNLSQSYAVGVNDGENDDYQLGYEGGGKIQITLKTKADGSLKYDVTSGFTTYTDLDL